MHDKTLDIVGKVELTNNIGISHLPTDFSYALKYYC
jgi:hypothetical protein